MNNLENFALKNKLKLNTTNTKVRKFSRSKQYDFPQEVSFSDKIILEEVSCFKLLGVMISNDRIWSQNTEYICKKAKKKIWLLINMKKGGLNIQQLQDAFKKEIRSILELSVPVWHSSLTFNQ